jgi:hypothetical protein
MRCHRAHTLLLLACGMCFALLAAAAQTPQPPVVPAKHAEPAAPAAKSRDLTKLTPGQRLCYISAHQAMEWLRRTNRQDGKFVYGLLPDLRVALDGDSFTAQGGAVFALARAARYFGDGPSLAISRQALLTLLLETTLDSRDKSIRYTAAPAHLVNRLSSEGQLVLAIHELPAPGKDLLELADQLCNHLRLQQQPSGALQVTETGDDPKLAARDDALECAGIALQGVLRSQKLQPAAWKLEIVRKERAFSRSCWQQKRSFALAVSHTPAWAEAYLLTQDQGYADDVYAMADWLCSLQYDQGDSVRAAWVGGFRPWHDGQALPLPPDIRSAEAAESLGAACRVARAAGDLPRWQRYSRALEGSLPFLRSLQYTENRMQHFAENYRPALLGGFHASAQDGKLRIDYTHHALSALVLYLEHVVE